MTDAGLDRSAQLQGLLRSGSIVRVMGAHNGLGARLIERAGFDGVWASGLEISTAYGLPDANILTMTENLEAARAIHEATALPVICDCDTGYGNASNVRHMVRRYEAAGVAAIVIEDKQFPKVNSFIPEGQELAPIGEFAGRIQAAKATQRNPQFMVFARVEALIAGWGMEEALRRANAYVDAGADGIVIHSKSSSPEEVLAFARNWRRPVPLVAIPTTYYQVTAEELQKAGFSMVIYANHGLRAAIRAMETTFRKIRESGTTADVEPSLATLKEVFELQGMKDLKEDEKRFSGEEPIRAVIPAARDHKLQADLHELLRDRPLCMLEIGGKSLLERQMEVLRSVGVTEIFVVGGHLHDRIRAEGARVLYNPDYNRWNCAQSILFAKEHLLGKTLIVYSDILFDRQILERLVASPHPVTLVMDRAYQSLPLRAKALDLVAVDAPAPDASRRRLRLDLFKPVRQVGKRTLARPTHEFIGVAMLSGQGVEELKKAWEQAHIEFRGKPFFEAPSVEEADFTDLLQYLIQRGVPMAGLEIEHGWSEIHSRDDYERARQHFGVPACDAVPGFILAPHPGTEPRAALAGEGSLPPR